MDASTPAGAARPIQLTGPRHNALLAALPPEELQLLGSALDVVTLTAGERLIQAGAPLEAVYFPITAIVSIVYIMAGGATTELAMTGREGVVGTALFADELASSDAIVQCGGSAIRLATGPLRAAIARGGMLPQLLMRNANALFTQIALTTVGSQHSSVEQKLCRWLLDRRDRSASNHLEVTQESIAVLLGVRRESITGAIGKLQQAGAICCRRGRITVADRPALELHAGECYQAARTAADRWRATAPTARRPLRG